MSDLAPEVDQRIDVKKRRQKKKKKKNSETLDKYFYLARDL